MTTIDRQAAQILSTNLRNLATRRDRTADVVIGYPRSRDRMSRLTSITGPKEAVEQHVGWIMANDHVVQCYEHMAVQILSAEVAGDKATIVLCQNLNAGD